MTQFLPGSSMDFVCEYDKTGVPTGRALIDGTYFNYFAYPDGTQPNPVSALTEISKSNPGNITVALDAEFIDPAGAAVISLEDTEGKTIIISLIKVVPPAPFSPYFRWDDGTLWDTPNKLWN